MSTSSETKPATEVAWKPLPPRRVRCYKCGYEWNTGSKLKFVTCPSCHYKIDSLKFMVLKYNGS